MGVERAYGSTRRPLVSVLTPSVPERGDMLAETRRSVETQTMKRWEHLVLVDSTYRGCAATVNALAAEAKTDWLFLLADDDLLLPTCLAVHYRLRVGADIVYSPPVVEGEPEPPFHGTPPGIPSSVLISRALWERLGGYDLSLGQCEDYDLFERALVDGAVFRRTEKQLWVYRFTGHNKSRGATFGPPR